MILFEGMSWCQRVGFPGIDIVADYLKFPQKLIHHKSCCNQIIIPVVILLKLLSCSCWMSIVLFCVEVDILDSGQA